MRVSQEVLEVLDRAATAGRALQLVGQLDRPLYVATNKALELAGGKWDRRAKAHLFPIDAADAIEPILLTGEITDAKKELQAFYTPDDVAAQVIAAARIEPGMRVLEPNAGEGALVRPARDAGAEVTCVEINGSLLEHLRFLTGYPVHAGDFLACDVLDLDGPFDRVVMNPPFTRQADARHVLHAALFLRPGGRLVAIMSSSVTFRDTALYRRVRQLVAQLGGSITPLPEGAFRSSGTNVNTVLVTLEAAR